MDKPLPKLFTAMRQRHEYKIVRDNFAYMLEDAVNQLCEEGAWQPIGGLCIRDDGVFFQALTRIVMESIHGSG